MHTGIEMLAVAFLLIWVGRPNKTGIPSQVLEGLIAAPSFCIRHYILSCFAFGVGGLSQASRKTFNC